jgi:hypothetical protein
MRSFAIPAALVLAALATTPAAAEVPAGSIFLRGAIGMTTQSLGDVNAIIEEDQDFFDENGLIVSLERFKGTTQVGGELGYRVNGSWSGGVGVSYHEAHIENFYFIDPALDIKDQSDLTYFEVVGNASYWISRWPGVFVGAQAGVGMGTAEVHFEFTDTTDPSINELLDGKYDGSGFVWGGFVGYQTSLKGGIQPFGRAGYRIRNLGTFSGSSTSSLTGVDNSPPTNAAGEPVDFDFSGVFLEAGFTWPFFSR